MYFPCFLNPRYQTETVLLIRNPQLVKNPLRVFRDSDSLRVFRVFRDSDRCRVFRAFRDSDNLRVFLRFHCRGGSLCPPVVYISRKESIRFNIRPNCRQLTSRINSINAFKIQGQSIDTTHVRYNIPNIRTVKIRLLDFICIFSLIPG